MFSLNEFCHRYARDILESLLDLRKTWVERELPGGTKEKFTITEAYRFL